MRINGTVDGDVKVGAEELVIGPDTRVSGTLFYGGPTAPDVPAGAVIAGGVKFNESHDREYWNDTGDTMRETASVVGSIVWFVGSFFVAALFAIVFPEAARRAAEFVGREPAKAVGVGFAMLLCLPIIGLLLVVTIIGIPLALLLIPVYLLLLFLGWVTTAMFLGQKGLAVVRAAQPVTPGWTIAALLDRTRCAVGAQTHPADRRLDRLPRTDRRRRWTRLVHLEPARRARRAARLSPNGVERAARRHPGDTVASR